MADLAFCKTIIEGLFAQAEQPCTCGTDLQLFTDARPSPDLCAHCRSVGALSDINRKLEEILEEARIRDQDGP